MPDTFRVHRCHVIDVSGGFLASIHASAVALCTALKRAEMPNSCKRADSYCCYEQLISGQGPRTVSPSAIARGVLHRSDFFELKGKLSCFEGNPTSDLPSFRICFRLQELKSHTDSVQFFLTSERNRRIEPQLVRGTFLQASK